MVNMDERFIQGLVIIPIFWLLLYALMGNYRNAYRKSRLRELGQTILSTLLGVTAIFFALVLDDEVMLHHLLPVLRCSIGRAVCFHLHSKIYTIKYYSFENSLKKNGVPYLDDRK